LEVNIPKIWEPVLATGYAPGIGRTISYAFIHNIRSIPIFGQLYYNMLPLPDASSGTPVINREGKVSGITVFFTRADTNYHCTIPSIRIVNLSDDLNLPIKEWNNSINKNWLSSEDGLLYAGLSRFRGIPQLGSG